MARLWSSGAELNSNSTNVELTGAISSVSSSIVRSGGYSFRCNAGSTAASYTFRSTDTDQEIYIRFYLYISTSTSGLTRILDMNGSLTLRASIKLNSNNTLELWNNTAQVGSDSSALSSNTWYLIELRIKTDNSAGSDILDARIDGSSFASSSTQSLGTLDRFYFGMRDAVTGDIFYDDIAINDSSGSFQNSWPGSGKIIHLKPNAAGDNSDWTNDYANVDEVTPDDASTLVSSNTLDQIDDHNIEAPAYLGDSDTVNVVQVGVRFNGAGASANASFVLRVKASASGTVEESSAITPSNTTWVTNAAAAPRNYPLTLYDLPGASTTAWTKADLTSAQIGYRLSSTSTNAAQISTVWLLVDYTPATASGVSLCFWKPYANQPPSSNYATLDTRNLHPVLDFNKTTQESAIFRGVMPRSYSGGDITVYLHWAATTVTTGTGGWDVAFERIGDGQQDIDSDGFAAAQQIGPDTVPATTGNVIITSVTMSNSACDSIAAGESFRLRVRRDVTNDNADDDLELLGVELRETA